MVVACRCPIIDKVCHRSGGARVTKPTYTVSVTVTIERETELTATTKNGINPPLTPGDGRNGRLPAAGTRIAYGIR